MFQLLQKRNEKWKKFEVGAVIISPTRELAKQIFNVLDKFFSKFPNLSQVLLVGGNVVREHLQHLLRHLSKYKSASKEHNRPLLNRQQNAPYSRHGNNIIPNLITCPLPRNPNKIHHGKMKRNSKRMLRTQISHEDVEVSIYA